MTQTLAETLAHRLRRDILTGRLHPGAPIKERDTAQDLGVSRTPMREAIRLLAQDGLVALRPSRSPIVANPTLKEITDSIEILVALEELSARLAVSQASDAELAAIRTIHENICQNCQAMDDVDAFEADMSFHRAIAEASHNAEVARVHAAYLARMWRARFVSGRRRRNSDRVRREHGAIIDALEARNADLSTLSVRGHLGHLMDRMVQSYHDQSAPLDAQAQDPTDDAP